MKRVIVFCDYIEANTIAKVLKITMIIIISWKIIRYAITIGFRRVTSPS